MSRRWDEYVKFESRGVVTTIRCYGPGTANAIAEQKRRAGFDNVKIIGRRAARRKDPESVSYSSLLLHQWSRSGD